VDVGTLGKVDVGVAALPVQLPRVALLLDTAPAHRARAAPVEGLKGVSVVLSTPTAPALSRVVVLQWRGLAALAVLLVLGLVCTAFAHTLFIAALRTVTAHTASVIAALEPVYGIALALLLSGWVRDQAPAIRNAVNAPRLPAGVPAPLPP